MTRRWPASASAAPSRLWFGRGHQVAIERCPNRQTPSFFVTMISHNLGYCPRQAAARWALIGAVSADCSQGRGNQPTSRQRRPTGTSSTRSLIRTMGSGSQCLPRIGVRMRALRQLRTTKTKRAGEHRGPAAMHAQDENNPMLYRRIHARNRVPPGGQSLLSKRRRHDHTFQRARFSMKALHAES